MIDDAIIEASPRHIDFLSSNIRSADIQECWLMGAIVVRDALLMSLERASQAKTWMVHGYPAAMGGISSRIKNIGIIWLLGSTLVDMYPRRFSVRAMAELEKAKKDYNLLYNYVSVSNTRYIEWLSWMGFELSEPEPLGPFKALFHRFEWRKNDSSI